MSREGTDWLEHRCGVMGVGKTYGALQWDLHDMASVSVLMTLSCHPDDYRVENKSVNMQCRCVAEDIDLGEDWHARLETK